MGCTIILAFLGIEVYFLSFDSLTFTWFVFYLLLFDLIDEYKSLFIFNLLPKGVLETHEVKELKTNDFLGTNGSMFDYDEVFDIIILGILGSCYLLPSHVW